MAGYSGTPLAKKLGIKQGHRVGLLAAPDRFEDMLEGLPEGTSVEPLGKKGSYDNIIAFVKERAELERSFPLAARRLDPAGGLWIAWPKKASGVKTDVTEDVVRDVALAAGLVDNKVCAIDETWSGLRCVIRLVDRPARSKVEDR